MGRGSWDPYTAGCGGEKEKMPTGPKERPLDFVGETRGVSIHSTLVSARVSSTVVSATSSCETSTTHSSPVPSSPKT